MARRVHIKIPSGENSPPYEQRTKAMVKPPSETAADVFTRQNYKFHDYELDLKCRKLFIVGMN